MLLYRVPPTVAFGSQSLTELSGCQTCTGVPPQFEEISPIGTVPPRASWTSRAVSQQTALNVFHPWPALPHAPPSAFDEAGSQPSRQD